MQRLSCSARLSSLLPLALATVLPPAGLLGAALVLLPPPHAVAGGAAVPPARPGEPPTMLVRVALDPYETRLAALEAGGFDIAGRNRAERWVNLVVSPGEMGRLQEMGLLPIVLDVSGPLREKNLEGTDASVPGSFDFYHDYQEVINDLTGIEAQYPNIAELHDLNADLGTPLTHEGRHLWALRISDNPTVDEDEPAFLFVGNHHARELNTVELVFDVAFWLVQNYGVDPDATKWVDGYEIWIVPTVNPDGLQYIWDVDNNWRKNRRDNPGSCEGVDQNRNYPFQWGFCGSTSSNPCSSTYRGPSPASEPENQTVMALVAAERPVFVSTYHSSGNEVLYPYKCADLDALERQVIYDIRDNFAAAMTYTIRVASASGEDFEWYYNNYGTLSFLTEINCCSFQPNLQQVTADNLRNRPGWQYLLDRMMGPGLEGHVRDAFSGQPVPGATLSIDEVTFAAGEPPRTPHPLTGRFRWTLFPGNSYTLRVSAPGYLTRVLPFPALSGTGPTVAEVRLVPARRGRADPGT